MARARSNLLVDLAVSSEKQAVLKKEPHQQLPRMPPMFRSLPRPQLRRTPTARLLPVSQQLPKVQPVRTSIPPCQLPPEFGGLFKHTAKWSIPLDMSAFSLHTIPLHSLHWFFRLVTTTMWSANNKHPSFVPLAGPDTWSFSCMVDCRCFFFFYSFSNTHSSTPPLFSQLYRYPASVRYSYRRRRRSATRANTTRSCLCRLACNT